MPDPPIAEAADIVLETTGCPVCGADGVAKFVQRDLLCGLEGVFGQRMCRECGVYFLSPRVPESGIGPYYPATYAPFADEGQPGWLQKLAWRIGTVHRRRRIVERFLPGGRLLDVGCGNGLFLDTLAGGSWETYAMDVQWNGRGTCPSTFYAGLFDHAAPPLTGLDAVTLWHVFEHLYHPRKALENAAAVLRPGGYLFLAIPDLRSLEPRLFGKCWIGWDPPRHVATYSRQGLEKLLQGAGFRLVGQVSDVCTGELILLNVEFFLRSKGFSPKIRTSLVLRAFLEPVAIALSWVGLAPAKVYVAQR